MAQAPRGLAAAVELMAARGHTAARVALAPQELGGIEIRLRTTAAGIVAQLVADRPEAAQQLQQAGGELRRALEAQGVTVLSLDIGTAGEREAGARAAAFAELARAAGERGEADSDLPPTTTPERTTVALPGGGVLIDVLA